MADYKTYADIYGDVMAAINQNDDAAKLRVKAVINMVYLNEVCVCDELYPLHWLMDLIDDTKTKTKATITGITKAATATVTATAHGFATGDIVQIAGVALMTEINDRIFVVVKTTADAFTLKDLSGAVISSSGYTAAGTGGYAYHRGETLIVPFRSIKSMNFNGYNLPLKPISFAELEENTRWYDVASPSKPTRYLHKAYYATDGTETQRLLWFSVPDAVYSARIWGEKIPSRLSADGDVPVLPGRYHDALVSGSVARLIQYGDVQIERAVIWPSLYKAHLDAIKNENREYWKKNNPDERSPIYLL